jgi:F0F1-type ATP synthase assembly protein I
VFDVLSIESFVCLNITVDADADLMCNEENKEKMRSETKKKIQQRINLIKNKRKSKEKKKYFEWDKLTIHCCFIMMIIIGKPM